MVINGKIFLSLFYRQIVHLSCITRKENKIYSDPSWNVFNLSYFVYKNGLNWWKPYFECDYLRLIQNYYIWWVKTSWTYSIRSVIKNIIVPWLNCIIFLKRELVTLEKWILDVLSYHRFVWLRSKREYQGQIGYKSATNW